MCKEKDNSIQTLKKSAEDQQKTNKVGYDWILMIVITDVSFNCIALAIIALCDLYHRFLCFAYDVEMNNKK